MEAQCGEESQGPDADEGQMLHALVHIQEPLWPAKFTDEQRNTLRSAQELGRRAIEMLGYGEPDTIRREVPLLKTLSASVELRGTADCLYLWNERRAIMVHDLKFGRLDVDDAQDNIQGVAYVVLAADDSVEQGVVAIIRPRGSGPERLTLASYDRASLKAARAEIERIIAATENEDAPLNTSPSACRYCRAKAICPAYTAELQAPKSILPAVVQKKDLPLALARLGTDELGRLMDAVKFANMIEDGLKAEIHLRIGEDRMPGWGLKNTGSMRSVEDILAVYHLLKDELEDAEVYQSLEEAKGDQRTFATDFMGCAKLQIGSVEKLVRELAGLSSDDKAKARVEALIGHLIVSTEKAKSVQREKVK